jgi:hypothetical protein
VEMGNKTFPLGTSILYLILSRPMPDVLASPGNSQSQSPTLTSTELQAYRCGCLGHISPWMASDTSTLTCPMELPIPIWCEPPHPRKAQLSPSFVQMENLDIALSLFTSNPSLCQSEHFLPLTATSRLLHMTVFSPLVLSSLPTHLPASSLAPWSLLSTQQSEGSIYFAISLCSLPLEVPQWLPFHSE